MLTGSRYCTRQQLVEAVKLVAQGSMRPVITRVYHREEADEVPRSIERMELAGHACAMLLQGYWEGGDDEHRYFTVLRTAAY